jgi:hypothetical protein
MIVIFKVRTFALPRKPKLDLVMLSAEKRLQLKFISAGKKSPRHFVLLNRDVFSFVFNNKNPLKMFSFRYFNSSIC